MGDIFNMRNGYCVVITIKCTKVKDLFENQSVGNGMSQLHNSEEIAIINTFLKIIIRKEEL